MEITNEVKETGDRNPQQLQIWLKTRHSSTAFLSFRDRTCCYHLCTFPLEKKKWKIYHHLRVLQNLSTSVADLLKIWSIINQCLPHLKRFMSIENSLLDNNPCSVQVKDSVLHHTGQHLALNNLEYSILFQSTWLRICQLL